MKKIFASLDEINMQQSNIEKTLQDISGLISLPEVYLKFRRLMDNPNSRIEDFGEVVSCDPNLAARVLKVANSAFLGFPGQIDSLTKATKLLGIMQLHDMVLGDSAIKTLDMPNDIVSLKIFWRSSLFAAIFTQILARKVGIHHADRLFVIGLLHEIGHLVMYAKYPEQAKLALINSAAKGQMIHLEEQSLLGFHYGEIGAKLMAYWQLPSHFQQMAQYQPTPAQASVFISEIALLHLAHGYAQKTFNSQDCDLDRLITPNAWSILNLEADQIGTSLDDALNATTEMENFILN